jgi:hypothetical protein
MKSKKDLFSKTMQQRLVDTFKKAADDALYDVIEEFVKELKATTKVSIYGDEDGASIWLWEVNSGIEWNDTLISNLVDDVIDREIDVDDANMLLNIAADFEKQAKRLREAANGIGGTIGGQRKVRSA